MPVGVLLSPGHLEDTQVVVAALSMTATMLMTRGNLLWEVEGGAGYKRYFPRLRWSSIFPFSRAPGAFRTQNNLPGRCLSISV